MGVLYLTVIGGGFFEPDNPAVTGHRRNEMSTNGPCPELPLDDCEIKYDQESSITNLDLMELRAYRLRERQNYGTFFAEVPEPAKMETFVVEYKPRIQKRTGRLLWDGGRAVAEVTTANRGELQKRYPEAFAAWDDSGPGYIANTPISLVRNWRTKKRNRSEMS